MKATLLIGGQSDVHERHEADFYPTPKECTIALLDFLKLPKKRIWEPACGDGAISKVLKQYGHYVTSTDIRIDSGYGEGGVDFLTANPMSCDAIITNPPFNISEDFIHRCYSMNLEMYAFVLKSTFWHSQKRHSIFQITKPSYVLPMLWRPNMCPERGKAPTMDFLWTVWIKGDEQTKYIPLPKPITKSNQSQLFQ